MPTANKQLRFVDKGVLLPSYARETIAVCPKCSGPVHISSNSKYAVPFDASNSRAQCLKCSFHASGKNADWFGPLAGRAKARCKNCGMKWLSKSLQRSAIGKKAWQSSLIVCPDCGIVNRVSIEWFRERFGTAIDPSFGLPLWLKVGYRGNEIWAYNGEHLNALRRYIEADLRERVGVVKWSMFNRLPKWMSTKKNRDGVLGCLAKLEKRCS